MPISVLEFGGTSLSDDDKRDAGVRNVRHELQRKKQVVIIVSAMGRLGDPYATDTLYSLTERNCLPVHQQSLLLSCGELISAAVFSAALHRNGIKCEILTGEQAGIKTDKTYRVDISSVDPRKLLETLTYA